MAVVSKKTIKKHSNTCLMLCSGHPTGGPIPRRSSPAHTLYPGTGVRRLQTAATRSRMGESVESAAFLRLRTGLQVYTRTLHIKKHGFMWVYGTQDD